MWNGTAPTLKSSPASSMSEPTTSRPSVPLGCVVAAAISENCREPA